MTENVETKTPPEPTPPEPTPPEPTPPEPTPPEPTPPEPTPPEPTPPEPTTAKIITDLKNEFDAQLKAMRTSLENEIAQRDEVIKSLLGGEPEQESIAARINARRNYKKW